MKTKCIACDGYGTRPHRSKPGKVVKCRVCSGLGYELSLAPFVPNVPQVPTVPWIDPIQPFTPNPWINPTQDPILPIYPWPPNCGLNEQVMLGGPGCSGGNA